MLTIGLMTGNSLDAVDAVLTEFTGNKIIDVAGISIPYSKTLRKQLIALNQEIITAHSNMTKVSKTPLFRDALATYTKLLIRAVEKLLKQSKTPRENIAAIGISGQSIGIHNPPSLAGKKEPFTTQIFDAATLAKATNIPVVYDVRSDDIFDGGEGAPLAPMHNLHLSYTLTSQGKYPVCFINGGNTGNIAVITQGKSIRRHIIGFDCGAFNHYVDHLSMAFYNKPCDLDGMYGIHGDINPILLKRLYQCSALTSDGKNFYDLVPPKSSGPHLYNMLDELVDYPLCREDILRTVEYFSAYNVFLSLQFVPKDFDFPKYFLLFGGGWRNPIIFRDFQNILHGRGIILPEHQKTVKAILERMRGQKLEVSFSDDFGFNGQYMEARIMADMAYCYLKHMPFTKPEITGCKHGVVSGILCKPGENIRRRGRGFTFSRASKGWTKQASAIWQA